MQVQSYKTTFFNFLILGKSIFPPKKSFITSTPGPDRGNLHVRRRQALRPSRPPRPGQRRRRPQRNRHRPDDHQDGEVHVRHSRDRGKVSNT